MSIIPILAKLKEELQSKKTKRLIMKFGVRKPSIKKSLKARTTGKAKRAIKKVLIPGYGKKGMGWVKNPRKAAYNKIYKKTSFSIFDLFK